jgi:hypothetical protein
MRACTTTKLLIAVLALGAAATMMGGPTATANAGESRTWNRVPQPPAVTFRRAPIWEVIPGTRVSWIRERDRPNYDLFRSGSSYYLYNDGYWYRSNRLDRRFTVIQERYVPMAFSGIPDNHWRNYPPGWRNPRNPHYSGRHDNGRNGWNGNGRNVGNDRGRNVGNDDGWHDRYDDDPRASKNRGKKTR